MRAGIARKNDSRVAVTRSRPRSRPAVIVAPDRETPGMRAKHCTSPMTSASAQGDRPRSRAAPGVGAGARPTTITALQSDQRGGHDPQVAQRAGDEVAGQQPDDRDRHRPEMTNQAEPVVERPRGPRRPPSPRTQADDDPHDVLGEVDQRRRRSRPIWMIAVKAVTAGSSIGRPSSFSAMVRWPVLETGRNSVSPSTTPSTTAASRSARCRCSLSATRPGRTRRAARPSCAARATRSSRSPRRTATRRAW